MFDVSIIIPTRNRSEIIDVCLTALSAEVQSNTEVLIIDTSSSDTTELIVSKYPKFKYHFLGDIPYSMVTSRNYGMKVAKGEIIIFIDDDCIVQKNWLSSLTTPFIDPYVLATGGRIIYHPWKIPNRGEPIVILDINNGKIWGEWDRVVENNTEVCTLPGGNCAIRKEKADKIDGFDPGFIYSANLEETDFFYRLSQVGGKFLFVPDAVVEHRAAQRTDRLERSQRNYLWRYSLIRNKVYFFRKHRSRRGVNITIYNSLSDVISYIYNQITGMLIFTFATIHGLISGIFSRTKYRNRYK